MNLNTKEKTREKVESLKKHCEEIVNQGVIGKGPFALKDTLKLHQRINVFLDMLEYSLQQEISAEDVLAKISDIETEIRAIHTELINK